MDQEEKVTKTMFIGSDEEEDTNSSFPPVEVVITNKFPDLQGFGLDVSGGTDRPYLLGDDGIFVSALKQKGLADKTGKLEVGDRILKVNGKNVEGVTHDKAVSYFLSNREQVSLQVKKKSPQVSISPPLVSRAVSNDESDSPVSIPRAQANNNNLVFSVQGFLAGILAGCIGVFVIRRIITASNT